MKARLLSNHSSTQTLIME